ncbi:ComEC/Rec2 family competence protein [Lysinibacillus contaminans]|uniref:ComEC/Rec2 family competence protein n=1 Tax=Lysinibacillus contaminans TaxID=1293441 RepID=UPI0006AEF4A2|nr:MBL fold metallo-hydrolase [Lysinibacillus contaminans]
MWSKILASLAVLLGFITGCANSEQADLEVKIFKIGKADSILVTVHDKHMLIDTGEDEDVVEVLSYLKDANITSLDTLIITHFDKDHVGGADHILKQLTVKQVLIPNYNSDSKQTVEFMEALEDTSVTATRINEPFNFEFGETQVSILPPHQSTYDGDNDYSLVTSVIYGETSFLFTGDAEATRLAELLDDGVLAHTFLKVPHHGRFNEQTTAFFTAVKPEIAVITASNKNPADEQTLDALQAIDADVYITKDGTITVTSDGRTLSVQQ